jgi:integrase
MNWYWERHGPKLRSTTLHFTLDKHVRPELGQLQLSEITAECIDELLTRKRDEISAETHNKIISRLRRMFELAAKPGVGLWRGANPLVTVERRRPPKRLPTTLNAEEVPLLLAELDGQDQDVIATALYTAMRKGEVGGLLETDLDLADGVIKLQRCWDGPATKDGKPLLVPIAPSLRPHLEAALEASGSHARYLRAPRRRGPASGLGPAALRRRERASVRQRRAWFGSAIWRARGAEFAEPEKRRPARVRPRRPLHPDLGAATRGVPLGQGGIA